MLDRLRRVFNPFVGRLPREFRVLVRQFLLRVIDLEALSVHADVSRFLGQFAGVLILINGFRTIGFLFFEAGKPELRGGGLLDVIWARGQGFVSMMMLVTGLIAVLSWDTIFPDRRDAMVLGPLPIRPVTILAARVAACSAVVAIAILCLTSGMGIVIPIVVGSWSVFLAWWITMAAACVFVYGAVLAVQGITALLLPRKMFLRLSAALQIAAFAWFVSSYFLEPGFGSRADTVRAAASGQLHPWPSWWFFALGLRIAGSPESQTAGLRALAVRAWLALAIVVVGAAASLALCYLRTMKKTVEEPDLVPGRGGLHIAFPLGCKVETAVVRFTARGLARSRHHRVIFAFYWAIVFAIAVSTLRSEAAGHWRLHVTQDFMMPTFAILCLAIVGLRSTFALPVSLNANWVLRVTQLQPSQRYLAGTRRALLLLSALPALALAALLGLGFRPLAQVGQHLAVLALVAWILAELCLLNVSKIPFACSYLPGKTNLQYVFWAFVVIFFPIAAMLANQEMRALAHPARLLGLLAILAALAAGLWQFNRHQARSAVLYYEELEPEVIQTLGIGSFVES